MSNRYGKGRSMIIWLKNLLLRLGLPNRITYVDNIAFDITLSSSRPSFIVLADLITSKYENDHLICQIMIDDHLILEFKLFWVICIVYYYQNST